MKYCNPDTCSECLYKLWLRFTTGEAKIFDFTPLLKEPGFAPLADEHTFAGVYIDYGVTVWHDGDTST